MNIEKLLLLAFLFITIFCQTEYMVQPNKADPLSGAPNNYHYIFINKKIGLKNKLFLFFPGTGAFPFVYRQILKTAANLGYHAIGLTYPNSVAINQICLTSSDITCHSRARLEVFDGINRTALLNVDQNNCIERRTIKLLQYLSFSNPTENWNQFFNGNTILWNKILVAGHSQGGGHAGIISKIKQVERVIMFAAMDWVFVLNRNADWITWSSLTPIESYYGFAHQKDEDVDFSKLQITWKNYGISTFGGLILVDSSLDPYKGSHQLYTQVTPANNPTKFHGCIVVDLYTPFVAGKPFFAPVWTYMIQGNQNLVQ